MFDNCDLHIHSIYSDGVKTPEEIFIKCVNQNFKAFSITDHDTIDGCIKAYEIKDNYDIEFLSGIEISCHERKREFHLLGYNFDINNDRLQTQIELFKKNRRVRAEKILQRLTKVKVNIELDYVEEIAVEAPITRPHIANAMLNNNFVSNLKEAFLLYLGNGRPGFVEKANFPIKEAISLINDAGGIASLAHPAHNLTQDILKRLLNYGIDGIEVVHPTHDQKMKMYYKNLASQYYLIATGGSDYHGLYEFDDYSFGKFTIPYSTVESIKISSNQ